MSKAMTLLLIVMLVSVSVGQAARQLPADTKSIGGMIPEKVDEDCERVGEEEGCLMRRTLTAHTDYIYTQSNNP